MESKTTNPWTVWSEEINMLADEMLKINPWAYVKKIHTRMTDTGDYITVAYLYEGGHVKGFGGSESAAIGMALTKIREYAGIE